MDILSWLGGSSWWEGTIGYIVGFAIGVGIAKILVVPVLERVFLNKKGSDVNEKR